VVSKRVMADSLLSDAVHEEE